MIRQFKSVWVIDTNTTTYAFRVLDTGHLEHLYYGERIQINSELEADCLCEKHEFAQGNTIIYDNDHPKFTLEDMRLEMSSYGKGDIREPFIEVIHRDGSYTSDFLFKSGKINSAKTKIEGMPSSYEENGLVEELEISLVDDSYDLELKLFYCVFPEKNIITRWSRFINNSKDSVQLKRLMSMQLDFDTMDYDFTSFHGAWTREMEKVVVPVVMGKYVNSSYTGSSSNRANPFVMISNKDTSENIGGCFGFNLVYSGNHAEIIEGSSFKKTRFLAGINPASFEFEICSGETFDSPEAVMTYSSEGFNGMSQNMHAFVKKCIVRGKWRDKERPVLLNSWEANYFNIDESKLLKLAKAGKEVGVELFVMDDGWFGERNDDHSSLGDWQVNKKKLPNGLKGICEKINDLGLDFGIWVEPEMVSVDSDLYRKHPEWVIEIPDKPHSEGRYQRILDLTNPTVVEYMTEVMTKVFSSANISYVKWDMNRIFSDVYSKNLPAYRQQEVFHRYICGFYKMLETLTERFPNILFEGCASGGNRFDLGMLCYFPQIWASDDTDALYRVKGQTNYSYGYPMSTITCHLSNCPNHQTLRNTPITTRFAVAAFGIFGYECNLVDMSKKDIEEIKEEITIYKSWREVLQFGDFYRGKNGNVHEWTCVSSDKKRAVGFIMKEISAPNDQFDKYTPMGLDREKRYQLLNRKLKYSIKGFGDLINTTAPIHVKPDGLVHNVIDYFVTMPGEVEDTVAYGSALMSAGINLKQSYAATGFNEEVRYFPDFASRLYFMHEIGSLTVNKED